MDVLLNVSVFCWLEVTYSRAGDFTGLEYQKVGMLGSMSEAAYHMCLGRFLGTYFAWGSLSFLNL